MDYQKTWEVMNDLEESFNRIVTIETLVSDLEAASNREDLEEIQNISKALSSYLPTYISHYDKASKRAWNNTVLKVAEKDVPYRAQRSPSLHQSDLYSEVVKYYES